MKSRIFILIVLFVSSFTYAQKETKVLIETSMGNITVKLYNETPRHRDNFIKLVKQGFYDSLLFHRVIHEFMIQGGDPDSKNAKPGQRLGNGGPGYKVPAEFNPALFHKKGALAAARESDRVNPEKKSSGSQFYIVQGKVFNDSLLDIMAQSIDKRNHEMVINDFLQKPENKVHRDNLKEMQMARDQEGIANYIAILEEKVKDKLAPIEPFQFTEEQRTIYSTLGGTPHLDGAYTVFGEVTEGLDVVDKIAAVETDQYNRPKTDVIMKMKIVK